MKLIKSLQIVSLGLMLTACNDSTTTDPQAATQADPPGEPARASCELTMGWDPWEPYQYEITGGHVFGLDVDLLTAVVRNAGCDLRFRKGSWRELLISLRDGEIDMLAGATSTEARGEFAWFTEPYRDEEFYLYVASGRLPEFQGKSFESIMSEGARIGVIDDYLYGDLIAGFQDDPEFEAQFQYSSMAETNFSRLLEGKVDGIIEDKFVGASIIRHKNLVNAVTPLELRFGSTAVRIMLSKNSVDAEQFERINQSVVELRESGAIEMVLNQYRNP